jgi:hypothetical protein
MSDMGMLRRIGTWLSQIGNLQVLYWLLSAGVGIVVGWLRLLDGYSTSQVALAALLAFAAATVILFLGDHLVRRLLSERGQPERHKVILHQLAEALAEMKASALTVGAWERGDPAIFQREHSERHRGIVMRVGQLVDQISYDKPTADTCRDFAQLCSFIVFDALHKTDYRESRIELDRMSVGLFRYLHAGKSVDRKKIDLPDWIRKNDEEAKRRGQDRDRSSVRRTA